MLKNHVFGSLNLNNSEIFRLSFEDIFLGTLDTYTKKMNPPSAVLGGGVHGKVCWLIAIINITYICDALPIYKQHNDTQCILTAKVKLFNFDFILNELCYFQSK